MKKFYTILAMFSALLATTINVPSTQYPTIQDGIDAALDGDGSINILDIIVLVNIILNDLDSEGADFNDDFTLSENSPCIDAGTADINGDGNDDMPEELYTDGNGDGISIPDMGAFEYIPEQQNSSGDLNGDGIITVNDIIMLVDIIIYYNGIGDPAGDLNGDGAITVNDIIIVVDIILYN